MITVLAGLTGMFIETTVRDYALFSEPGAQATGEHPALALGARISGTGLRTLT